MTSDEFKTLGDLSVGAVTRIKQILGDPVAARAGDDVECRLLEIGFVEGEELEVLHHGPINRDPIAVRIGTHMLALRQTEAQKILVEG